MRRIDTALLALIAVSAAIPLLSVGAYSVESSKVSVEDVDPSINYSGFALPKKVMNFLVNEKEFRLLRRAVHSSLPPEAMNTAGAGASTASAEPQTVTPCPPTQAVPHQSATPPNERSTQELLQSLTTSQFGTLQDQLRHSACPQTGAADYVELCRRLLNERGTTTRLGRPVPTGTRNSYQQ